MHSFQKISLVASLLSPALALPAGGPQHTGAAPQRASIASAIGHSVKNIANVHFGGHNGQAAKKQAISKYGGSIPELASTTSSIVSAFGANVLLADAPSASTSSTASPAEPNMLLAKPGDADATSNDGTDLAYLTPVMISGKQYLLTIDTGSSNLWIGGNQTAAVNKYVPTGPQIPGNWTVYYASATNVSGDVFTETVSIGESIVTQVAVGHALQAAASQFKTGNNGQPGSDGLLGLGFSSANTFVPKQKTWFDEAVSQGLDNVFAANLMPGSIAGSYDFGFINPSSYSGNITYVNVDHQTADVNEYWTVTPTKGDRGVMDTGSTLLLLSNTTTTSYYAQISGAGYDSTQGAWTFPCNATAPDFDIEFGDHKVTIPGSFMIYTGLPPSNMCYGAIQDRGDLPFSIYGDRFFMTQYVVFDNTTGVPRIGFANKAA